MNKIEALTIPGFPSLAVGLGYWKALHPLLCVGAILGLQNVSLFISREDLEGLGNVPSTLPGHLDAPDGAHIQVRHVPQVVVIVVGLQKKTMSRNQTQGWSYISFWRALEACLIRTRPHSKKVERSFLSIQNKSMWTFHLQCQGHHEGSTEHSQGLQDLLVSC